MSPLKYERASVDNALTISERLRGDPDNIHNCEVIVSPQAPQEQGLPQEVSRTSQGWSF